MNIPSIIDMLKAGVHFGHQKSRWHPKMKPFIFTERHGIHILDLEQTRIQMEEVANTVKNMAANGKKILFVTTKPQAKKVVKEAAERAGMPYLTDRWIGGLLTNFSEMKKLIRKYTSLKEQRDSGELEKYTKKERLDIIRDIEKMDTYLGGLESLDGMPDALFLPSVQREKTALIEANRTGVPIVGVCDTNANPTKVQHVIAGNDDAVKSIDMIVNIIADAAAEGKKEWDKKQTIDQKKTGAPKGKDKKKEERTISEE